MIGIRSNSIFTCLQQKINKKEDYKEDDSIKIRQNFKKIIQNINMSNIVRPWQSNLLKNWLFGAGPSNLNPKLINSEMLIALEID